MGGRARIAHASTRASPCWQYGPTVLTAIRAAFARRAREGAFVELERTNGQVEAAAANGAAPLSAWPRNAGMADSQVRPPLRCSKKVGLAMAPADGLLRPDELRRTVPTKTVRGTG
jgi:hypothetical protein